MRTITAASDRRRAMPASPVARLDAARAALESLDGETRRLQRMALEPALTHCRNERRYWSFIHALISLPLTPTLRTPGVHSWPSVADR